MNVLVNGENKEFEKDITIYELLTNYDINPDLVVVEKNGIILKKENLSDENVKDKDKIEIIRFMGGG